MVRVILRVIKCGGLKTRVEGFRLHRAPVRVAMRVLRL